MRFWIIPYDEAFFHLEQLMVERDYVYWHQGRNKYCEGDIVYIYNSFPFHRLRYKMVVEKTNVPEDVSFNDKEFYNPNEIVTPEICVLLRRIAVESSTGGYTIDDLRNNGIIKKRDNLQGAHIIDETKATLLDSRFIDCIVDPEPVGLDFKDKRYHEGALKKVYVNAYERDSNARNQCLKEKGYSCSVCGINLENVYGAIGKGFIHVHHIIPISSIGKDYQVNPSTDLIPVCPNCHSMLHRGENGQTISVKELQSRMKTIKQILNG